MECRGGKVGGRRRGLPPQLDSHARHLAGAARREEVLRELYDSNADSLILLGDQPIRHFLRHYDARFRRLSDFESYGLLHDVTIEGRKFQVLPLAHVRQIGALGAHSQKWCELHRNWERDVAHALELGARSGVDPHYRGHRDSLRVG